MKYFSKKHAGFSLVEITIALGVMAFCLVAIFGLLPVGLTSNQISVEQSTASGIATNIIADLRAAPTSGTTANKSPRFQIPIPTTPTTVPTTLYLAEDGSLVGTIGAAANASPDPTLNPRYRATLAFKVTIVTIPSGPPLTKMAVRVLITWPALADPNPATNSGLPTNYTGSFETVIALDRT